MSHEQLQLAAWAVAFIFMAIAGLCMVVERSRRKRNCLRSYRATPDNRWPQRDEFNLLTKDFK